MFSYLLRMYSEFGESPRVAMSGEMVSLAGIEKNEEEWVFSEKSPLPASSPIQTKKKKRRKSHRPRSHSCSSDTVSKEVTWGNVEEVLFSRSSGISVVPSSGLYPLGLGDVEDTVNMTVDDHCKLCNSFEKPISSISSAGTDVTKKLMVKEEHERILLLSKAGNMSNDVAVNKEISEIRAARLSIGCSCKPLKSDKMSVQKLKSELYANGHKIGITGTDKINALSKQELIVHVREVLKQCQLCVENSCECVLSGVGCSAEICGCLKKTGVKTTSCHNPEGQYVYDVDFVSNYRKSIIDDWRKGVESSSQ